MLRSRKTGSLFTESVALRELRDNEGAELDYQVYKTDIQIGGEHSREGFLEVPSVFISRLCIYNHVA